MTPNPRRPRPQPWSEKKASIPHPALTPVYRFNWMWEWLAHLLGNWVFLEVLEYLGRFSVLIAVIFYFAESGDRKKQKHYQAWQVINTAQGKGGNGGRIDALQELNHDHVALAGVDLSGAFLEGIRLPRAELLRANLERCDIRHSVLTGARLTYADLQWANLRESVLTGMRLEGAHLENADLAESDLSGTDFTDVSLNDADLRNANVDKIAWRKIANIKLANVFGVKNAPAGFLAWATEHGAVSIESDEASEALEQKQ